MSFVIFLVKDVIKVFELQYYLDEVRELMKFFYVGQYLDVRILQIFFIIGLDLFVGLIYLYIKDVIDLQMIFLVGINGL